MTIAYHYSFDTGEEIPFDNLNIMLKNLETLGTYSSLPTSTIQTYVKIAAAVAIGLHMTELDLLNVTQWDITAQGLGMYKHAMFSFMIMVDVFPNQHTEENVLLMLSNACVKHWSTVILPSQKFDSIAPSNTRHVRTEFLRLVSKYITPNDNIWAFNIFENYKLLADARE